jgi:hypothetical protein
MCFFGAPTLRRIIPYVLTGIAETPTLSVPASGSADQSKDDSRLATWILPLISWMILGGILIRLFIHH